ncbi:hypothetical protein [Thalassotalea atypica]|uniref:hypothetical protein n=1 Tax=Thalassotalea atypica TaxID=2054316 RepID=UPI0025747E8E|nr:hypothetical protein [Thalassotalea atypica]
MLSLSMIFGFMMLPGIAVLAMSFIVSFLESEPVSLARKMLNSVNTKEENCWEVEA